jgi:hypothetical protein
MIPDIIYPLASDAMDVTVAVETAIEPGLPAAAGQLPDGTHLRQ